MKVKSKLRGLLVGAVIFITLALLYFMLSATRVLLDTWDRMQTLPSPVFYSIAALLLGVALSSVYIVAKLVWGGRQSSPHATRRDGEPLTEASLEEEIRHIEEAGMDTAQFREELEKLRARRDSGQIHIAFFGDVSTGKSSIIKALLPDANVEVNLRGGSTREIKEYVWYTPVGDQLLLVDLPGRNEAEGTLDEMARDEAIRAQIVVYVVDSDINRTQMQDIWELYSFGKPMIIAFNKSDLYSPAEKKQLTERIQSRFKPEDGSKQNKALLPAVIFIQAGGTEEVVKVSADGTEMLVQRQRQSEVSALTQQLQKEIDTRMELLEHLRDASVFSLVQRKMDDSRDAFRRFKAGQIVRSSTRNAMLGAMAAISPGTDIVIQGVIGARMVKQLCDLYDVKVTQLDIDNFLDFSQGQVKKSIPLILAVAGNGLKAFPGIGTVAGGLVHAVAYGLIFDALGHSVALTLEQRGALKAAPTALTFREMLSGNLEERTKALARVAFDQYKQKQKEERSSRS